jgi:hypothetical protein
MKHTTGWAEDGVASVFCDGTHVGQVLTTHEGMAEFEPCDVCGTPIRLRWNVHIEEGPTIVHEKKAHS